MLVREQEPVNYTSTSNDWSAATIFLAGAVLALLGFFLYFFGIMHAVGLTNDFQPQTVIQHGVATVPLPTKPLTPTQPIQATSSHPLPTSPGKANGNQSTTDSQATADSPSTAEND